MATRNTALQSQADVRDLKKLLGTWEVMGGAVGTVL